MYKKIISMVLIITGLLMLNSCGSSIPASEWGFENLADMDYKMLRVLDYSVEGTSDDYVVIDKGLLTGFKFEDGNRLVIGANIDSGMIDVSEYESGTFDYKYEIVDNDNINLNNGYSEMHIKDRITSEYRDNFVIFDMYLGVSQNDKLIPYTLLDFERGVDFETVEVEKQIGTGIFSHTNTIEGYKLYLK